MENFDSKKIRELRKKSGFSQTELGRLLGISNRAVSKWETGLSDPSFENVFKLSKIFDVSVDYFIKEKKSEKHGIQTKEKGMESIRELYKIGRGPSSSHTIGPEKACVFFKERNSDADYFKVILYGSLAKTGKGHGTDTVIKKTFSPMTCDVIFDLTKTNLPHPNTMELISFKNGAETAKITVCSIGGGSIEIAGVKSQSPEKHYNLYSFSDIADYCTKNEKRLWEFAAENEDDTFWEYLQQVWETMKKSIQAGLKSEGVLPGGLNVQRKARYLFNIQHIDESEQTKENRLVCSYAFAVGEQNAAGETIVTAPTCGAAGILPAVLYYHQQKHSYTDTQILHALAAAGIVGNLIKTNASISGAECGCQAEVGSACAMAAAALAELYELNIDKIEYAAEIAIEHHLGLTCDPICGLVQIPCIERNAVAAMRAINAVNLASFLYDTRKISLDKVIKIMKETGLDMHTAYKETSEAGLAKIDITK